jgi:Malectin domain
MRVVLALAIGQLVALNLTPHAAPARAPVAPARGAAPANTAVTTLRNDNTHSGQYTNETVLNESNVNQSQFGKRVSYPVDGQLYAQPLYLPNLSIGGGAHNVVFAATENDSVYAFDADATSAVAPLWKTSLLPSGATAVSNNTVSCNDLQPLIGITGTPVIDPGTGTMYVVAYSDEGGNLVYRLHALDVTTGHDKGAAIVIQASVSGTGVGGSGGTITFDPRHERQRVALVLANGKVYVAFASFCDNAPYHGWILSYSFSGTSFQQVNVYNDTPNGMQGGIWGGDAALIADPGGNLFYASGNGTFDANTGGVDMGDSYVRLNASLQRQDFFTPFNQQCLSQGDQDLGSSGLLLIPGANVLIGAGKEGRPYVVSTTSMGGYTADPSLVCGGTDANRTDIDKIQQELPPGTVGPLFSTPAIWNGPNGQVVYFAQSNGPTRAFTFSGGKLSTAPTSTTSANGGDPVVSSNGTTAGSAIVWNLDFGATLHAYDPTNLAHELYDSNQNSSRDGLSGFVKFSSVMVTNGQVFVGLSSSLAIFGLLGGPPPPPPPPATLPLRISAGGPAAAPFVADELFSGGTTVSTTKAVDVTGVTSPAPESVYQHNRFGTFGYAIPGLTAGTSYTVRLHFAETFWTTKGSRIFNVAIDGQQVLTNFDIIGAAGAAQKAVVEQLTAAADSSGTLSIQFNTVKDNAQVNGIEILAASPPPPPPPATVQISCGGPAAAPFVADELFSGGTAVSTTKTVDVTGVTNPAPESVYQHNRFGTFGYAIPGLTAGKSYTVRLHFAETFWTTKGSRIFNVVIDGQQVLTNFDIIGAAGAAQKAVVEQFTAAADSSGKITIQFNTVKDNAQVNGIEVQ